MSNCVFKFYFSFNTMQKDLKTIKHNDYNHEVLKINLSLLSIISILCWRSAKQFLELIFSVGETPKLSRHSLKLPPLDVTGKIRINLLSAKHKLVVWMNLSSFIQSALEKRLIVIYRSMFSTRNFPNEYR